MAPTRTLADQNASLWCRFSSNVTSARIANMARTSVHGSAYENMRFVYLSSLFDDADRLLAAARRACNGVDACEKRVAFMESGSKHGRLMAEGQYKALVRPRCQTPNL